MKETLARLSYRRFCPFPFDDAARDPLGFLFVLLSDGDSYMLFLRRRLWIGFFFVYYYGFGSSGFMVFFTLSPSLSSPLRFLKNLQNCIV